MSQKNFGNKIPFHPAKFETRIDRRSSRGENVTNLDLVGNDAASGWAGWNLGVQFTLFQPGGGADYTHHITACQPGFENLAASLPHEQRKSRNPCIQY